jgi:hypothetical protein
MRTLFGRFAFAAIVCVGIASCRDASAPRHTNELRGDFVVVKVNGARLPVDVSGSLSGLLLLADTLHFDGAGNAAQSRTLLEQTSTTSRIIHGTQQLTYEVDGPTLRLFAYCPPNANCAALPQGTIMDANHMITLAGNMISQYERR